MINEIFAILEQQLIEGVEYPQVNINDLNSDEDLMSIRQSIEERFKLRALSNENEMIVNGTVSRNVSFFLDRKQILVFEEKM